MWFDADNRPDAAEDDDAERYPFFPVDAGHPIAALMALVCAVGVIVVVARVLP